ncbi:MAG: MFS transporter [Spirochaetes bacterium]|nr:MFS transporter [Spirochaetota bacterium]
MINKDKTDRIWNPKFTRIAVIAVIFNISHFMMNTLIPKYVDSLGATAAIVGVVSSMFAIMSLSIRPVSGPATDYYRKNRLMSISLGLVVLSFIGYGLSDNLTLIIISRLIHGMGIGVAAPLSMAMASSTLPEDKLASGLGIFTLGQAIATAIAPSIGLALSGSIGYSATFFIVAGFIFIGFILALQLKSSAPPKKSKFRIQLKRVIVPDLVIPATVAAFTTIGFASISFFIIIYGGLRGISGIGLYFTAYAIALLVSRPLSGRIADRYGVDKAIVPGLLIFGVSFLLISMAKGIYMFLIAGVISAFGYGICIPLLMAMSMQLVPRSKRGAASNTIYTGLDVGYISGPILAGFVITGIKSYTGNEITGYEIMYMTMLLPIFTALVIYLFNMKKLKKKLEIVKNEQAQAA